MFLFSIITVNLNNLTGLQRTFESVLSQANNDFEFIVVDGISTDGSVEYLHSNVLNVQHLIIEQDNGVYDAMNKGIRNAQGKYLLFLNSGDILSDNLVLSNVSKFTDSQLDLIFGDCTYDRISHTYNTNYPEKLNFSQFYTGGINHQCVFFKRSLFDRFGMYDTDFKFASDWYFMLKILESNVFYKKMPFIISRVEPAGLSSTVQYYNERSFILNKYFSFFINDLDEYLKIKNEHTSIVKTFSRILVLMKAKIISLF